MDYLEALNTRYSVKKFEEGFEIDDEVWNRILSAGSLSVSSLGMQPYYVKIISHKREKETIAEAFFNNTQALTCSKMLVFVVNTALLEDYLQNYTTHIQNTRQLPDNQIESFRNSIKGFLGSKTPDEILYWAGHQAYICMSSILFAAALEGVDTCPLEGFNAAKMDALLSLPEHEKSVVCLALGKRSEDDVFSTYKKVRKPLELLYRHGL